VAQRTLIQLVDDLDGSAASATVEFALDGKAYQIDLSDENASRLRDALEPFVEAARRPGASRRPSNRQQAAGRQTTSRSAASDREHNNAVREWARANGWEVADRGRIPAGVVEAYENLHS
jgi:Lsr2